MAETTAQIANELPPEAREAWFAYMAMLDGKQQHFALLNELESKYGHLRFSSGHERTQLAQLLDTHNGNVSAFKAAMDGLRASNPQAHQQVLHRLADVNRTLDGPTSPSA